MQQNLPKNYEPKNFEEKIYSKWEKSGAFTPSIDKDKKPFTIVMPPPNITGQLHMGHALDHTLQDIIIRWKRMTGFSTLWLPGSDHASIATEVKVVDEVMRTEGKTKEELGREEFLKRAWDWKYKYGGKITEQCRKLGDSCDWTRERFTMDEGCNKAVVKFFVELYKKGLIYRGNRLINWCPKCATSLSDAEVEHEDQEGNYWYFRYPAADDKNDDIVVATSRPETMFGDTAIAVNPNDERYSHMIGTHVSVPVIDRKIPIIADSYPDPDKGTGAVKITPAHDPNDFEVGQRADLECISCIDQSAKMNEVAGKYNGLDRYECRKKWVAELAEKGYLVKEEKVVIPVGKCYRCHTIIEPMLSDQWFVKMKNLAAPALDAAKTGELKHVPQRFEKVYVNWLNEIRDWCISRQLWWGHRIPAWYCDDCGEITVSEETPSKCSKCNSTSLKQDEDVLDTWFSSGLWPMSTLGWPEKTPDFEYFYPTDVLVTGYDIILFWVIRMVFSACELTGKTPFEYVYLHGLVRDSQGRKMSKSLGNGIDPLDIIDEYGADALRFMIVTGITPGSDLRIMMDKIESSRNFANKLWNASRFVIMNIKDEEGNWLPYGDGKSGNLKPEDRWIIDSLARSTEYVNKNMEKFELALAGQKIYDLIWNEFCDWYIEIVKKRLWSDDEEDKAVARGVLIRALKDMLKLLHPFMPFITEEIWGSLPNDKMLISSEWPSYEDEFYEKDKRHIELAMETIKAIRNIRAEVDAAPSLKLQATIIAKPEIIDEIKTIERYIKDIANVREISFSKDIKDAPKDSVTAVITGAVIHIPMDELVDFEAEYKRLLKEKKMLEGEVKRAEGKLKNKGFVSKAPAELIEKERSKLLDYEEKLSEVSRRLEMISDKVGK